MNTLPEALAKAAGVAEFGGEEDQKLKTKELLEEWKERTYKFFLEMYSDGVDINIREELKTGDEIWELKAVTGDFVAHANFIVSRAVKKGLLKSKR